MAICSDCGLRIGSPEGHDGDRARARCSSCRSVASERPDVRLSPLSREDLELVLAWRSNPEIYRHFREQDAPLEWDEHVAWYESRDPDRYDFVVHYDGRRVGVVSIASDDEVGIYLGDISAQGYGVATTALNWLCDRFESRTPLIAEIHEENESSKRLFRQCGFERDGADGEWLRFVYDS